MPNTDDQPRVDGSSASEGERGATNRRWEILNVMALSLATVASAWCAYQAALWDSRQSAHVALYQAAGFESSALLIEAHQYQAADAMMLIAYVEAESRGDRALQELLRPRFRPPMRVALEAWLKTDPFKNPDSPRNPMLMKEYVLPEADLAKAKRKESADELATADRSGGYSDRYVRLTVLFASVMFFAGISGTFDVRGPRIFTSLSGIAVMVAALTMLAGLPVAAL